MKAQVLTAFNTPYKLLDVPLPPLTDPHDLLIKVEAASYCHTDAVLAAGGYAPNPPSFPHVGSHEFAGTIVAVHESSSSDLRTGDRVGVPGRSFHPCGECFECLDTSTPNCDPAGYSMYCPKSKNNGISKDGGFSEYQLVDSRQCVKLPDSLTALQAAPLMCAGITIFNALKRCALQPGQRVGIIGCGGGLGHLGLQFATKMGLEVTGVDNADRPLELARGLHSGATIVDARAEDADAIARRVGTDDGKTERGDMGLDAVIVLPESQKAFDFGIKLLRNHGRCIVLSFPSSGFTFSCQDVVFRDISIMGSLVGSVKTMKEMMAFIAKYGLQIRMETYPLPQLNEMVEKYHEGSGGKLVVDMSL